jgi:hypothetical protein
MPQTFDDPKDEGLLQTLVQRAQQNVDRKLQPIPAGAAAPTTLRAIEAVRKTYPKDMVGVGFKEEPWTSRTAFSSQFGATPVKGINELLSKALGRPLTGVSDNPDEIELNPMLGFFPQHFGESVVAHELQHVRQNRRPDSTATDSTLERLKQMKMPYGKQPDEVEAFKAQADYNKAKGYPGTNPDPASFLLSNSFTNDDWFRLRSIIDGLPSIVKDK